MLYVCPNQEISFTISIVSNALLPAGAEELKLPSIHWCLKKSTFLYGIMIIVMEPYKLNLVQLIRCLGRRYVLERKAGMPAMETEEVLWFVRKMGNGIKSASSASASVVVVEMSLEFTQK